MKGQEQNAEIKENSEKNDREFPVDEPIFYPGA
jgi:hypothetical protein